MGSLIEPDDSQKFVRLSRRALQNLRVGMKEHMLSDRSYRHFADFFITLAFIKFQVTGLPVSSTTPWECSSTAHQL